jgi:hypothetical protein
MTVTNAEWAIERSFVLSPRVAITFTAGPNGFVCDWSRKPGPLLSDAGRPPTVPPAPTSSSRWRPGWAARSSSLRSDGSRPG